MLVLTKLRAGVWDEDEVRRYLHLVQWAAQRIRSIDQEEYPLFVRSEQRFADSYLFGQEEAGVPSSILLEATLKALAKPKIDPQDLVNILVMMRRETRLIPMIGSAAGLEDFYEARLEPQLRWLATELETV